MMLISASTNAVQAGGLLASLGEPSQIATLLPGDQLVLSDHSTKIDFAGQTIALDGFTGIIGYASDFAYVVCISGSAQTHDKVAKRGRILILPPYGGQPSVARFDAGRLLASWSESERSEFAPVLAELQVIAKGQSRGIFLGSLSRTGFNVAASGSASEELARRSIVGGAATQGIRFDALDDQTDYEKAVVTQFAQALASGDVGSVAQLMDPLPFGLSDLRGEPGDARMLAAEHLAYERNWAELLGQAEPEFDAEQGVWTIAGRRSVIITLRGTQDIPFVKSIRVGG